MVEENLNGVSIRILHLYLGGEARDDSSTEERALRATSRDTSSLFVYRRRKFERNKFVGGRFNLYYPFIPLGRETRSVSFDDKLPRFYDIFPPPPCSPPLVSIRSVVEVTSPRGI